MSKSLKHHVGEIYETQIVSLLGRAREELPQGEIADRIEVPVKTVRQVLRRFRRRQRAAWRLIGSQPGAKLRIYTTKAKAKKLQAKKLVVVTEVLPAL